MASAPLESPVETAAAALAVLYSRGEPLEPMILLLNPRATKPKNRRYPLSLLAIGAVLEGKEEYTSVDGNIDDLKGADPWSSPDGEKLLRTAGGHTR